MVDPVPVNPLRRRVVYASPSRYVFADVSFGRGLSLSAPTDSIEINRDDPLARRAAETPEGRTFLRWSRLPFFVIQAGADSALVRIADARYTRGVVDSWASVRIVVPAR